MELLTCTKCNQSKEATSDFFPPHNKKRNGLDSWCRVCRATYRSEIRRGKYRNMGCDDATIKELLNSNQCTICGDYSSQLVIDHCHKSNTVRGVLCNNCNMGLGKFKDDPELLEFARIYILSHTNEKEAQLYIYGELNDDNMEVLR